MTGDRITDIKKTGKVRLPKAARVIDTAGKFLVPGLWDMHIHWYDERFLPIEEHDVATAVRQYHDLKTREPNTYDFRESELCGLGYSLLGAKKVKDAIEIFKLNVVAYPQSSDVYSCLGEAYIVDGDKESAIANYKRSLELDPQNTYAAEMLKKLKKK